MSKFGGFFARKTGGNDKADAPGVTALPDNPLELDEELFSALGAQIGGENEQLRTLMLDANAKISELDTIKAAVGKLVDPVSKALQVIESERSEKVGLQTVLNNTRTAYGKLRNEAAELEKKSATFQQDCERLRQELVAAHNALHIAETTKAEISIDIAARRAQIAELEARLAAEVGESKALRDENQRLDERLVTTEKRIITLEADLNSARQRLLTAEDEKRAQQASLDKASAEAARFARKLAETEASLATTQGRLRHVEANLAEANMDRSRLTTALDEANERHEHDLTTQRMRFDALQARALSTEKLLVEAREHLLARAEEVREIDRRAQAIARERDTLQAHVSELEADRVLRESEFKEADQARSLLLERSAALARAFNGKESALEQAEERISLLNDRIEAMQTAAANERQAAEASIEELTAALRREKMERAVVQGALDSGRKDLTRLMREVMALQRNQQAAEEPAQPRAANAA